MTEALDLVECFLRDNGYYVRNVTVTLKSMALTRFMIKTHCGHVTFAESDHCPACVELWVGGSHIGKSSVKYKYMSAIAFRVDLHDPNSLQRILEILEDPVEKKGDCVLKAK